MVNLIHLIVFIRFQLQPLFGELPNDLVREALIVAVIEYPGFHEVLRRAGLNQRQRLLIKLMPIGPFDQIDKADIALPR